MKKRPTPKSKDQHAVLLRLPKATHRELVERAKQEERSTVAHLRFLIDKDLKEAA